MSKSVDGLIGELKHGRLEIREEAAFELGGFDEPQVVAALLDSLQNDNEVGVRSAAAESLGRLGKKEAFDPLMQGLKSSEYMVRSACAFALGKLGDKRAADSLFFLLKDTDHSVVSSAAHALAKMHDKRAVLPLVHIVEAGRHRQQSAAVRALGDLRDPLAVPVLVGLYKKVSDPDLKQIIIRALDDISAPGCEEVMIQALEDGVSFIRRYAADALGNIRYKGAVEKLKKLSESDEDTDVRNVAKEALKKIV
jgi:HEAT repeat protein